MSGPSTPFYAGDGRVFLEQAVREAPSRAFRTPYRGYFHFVPRLLAEVAAALPLQAAAETLALEAALVVGVIVLVVFRAASGHIRSVPVRVLLAASIVLVPSAQEEVFNNVTNLHWFFLFASVWVLLWVPHSSVDLALGAAVLFLGALSDPLAKHLGAREPPGRAASRTERRL